MCYPAGMGNDLLRPPDQPEAIATVNDFFCSLILTNAHRIEYKDREIFVRELKAWATGVISSQPPTRKNYATQIQKIVEGYSEKMCPD